MSNTVNNLAAVRPSGLRMRVSAIPRMGPEDLKALLYRPEMLRKWIGPGVTLPCREGALATLPAPDGSLTQQLVTRVRIHGDVHSLTLGGDGYGTRLTISVGPAPGAGASVVRVTVGQLQNATDVTLSLAIWQAALNRLVSIVHAIRRRRSPRQALIVIHGIGEQKPGETLMEFVRAVFGDDVNGTPRWVKPDTLSDSFEMRKVTVNAAPSPPGTSDAGRPTTDVYELYWAHLIRDSTVGQVLAWLKKLVLSKYADISPSLRPHVLIVRILILIVVLSIIVGTVLVAVKPDSGGGFLAGGGLAAALIAVGGLLWNPFRKRGIEMLTGHLGDAARYFEAKPDNIARRQEIREAGVHLLERLHETGEYQRIVVAGHSLGSAIAYDILTFAWERLRRQHASPDSSSNAKLTAVEQALMDKDATPITLDMARDLQYAAWREHRKNTQPWLVTDLVTMGSPLTHGNLLMAERPEDFPVMQRDRTLPTCPPQAEPTPLGRPRISYNLPDRSTDGSRPHVFIVPDHGALFALTRWTNLYFPFHGIIGGDPVGGPLQPLFGRWIADRPVRTRKVGFMGFAHTRYWVPDGEGPFVGLPGEDHIECLRDALDLNCASSLASTADARPAYTYL